MKEGQRVDDLMSSLRSFDERVHLAVNGGINRGPLERTEGVVKLYEQAREIAACPGFELGEQSVGGASDGNFVAALDVPVLDGLGIDGSAQCQCILISDIRRRSALLAGLIATL